MSNALSITLRDLAAILARLASARPQTVNC